MEDEYTETYSLAFTDSHGFNVENTFEGGYLPDVLTQVSRFLQASGFSYIVGLQALTSDLKVHSTSEI